MRVPPFQNAAAKHDVLPLPFVFPFARLRSFPYAPARAFSRLVAIFARGILIGVDLSSRAFDVFVFRRRVFFYVAMS